MRSSSNIFAKSSFTEQYHSTIFVWQSAPMRTFYNIVDSFLVLKITLIYAKILQSAKMSRLFPNLNLKNLHVTFRKNITEICRQDVDIRCWWNFHSIGAYVDSISWIFLILLTCYRKRKICAAIYLQRVWKENIKYSSKF